MSGEQAAFLQTVTDTLSSDNALRNAAEKRYGEARAQQPAATVAGLFQVLQAAEVWQPAREQGAVLLRQCLSKAREDGSVWAGLGAAGQADVRAGLLRVLEAEPQPQVRRKVADCVQSLGNQIIDISERPANAPEWPELMPMLMRTVADASKDSGVRSDCLWAVKEMTVSIWQVLVASAGQSQQLLRGCLADPAEGVRGEAASLLCSLVDNIESREERVPFAPLIPDFCTVLTQLAGSADSKHLNTVLQSLQATTETCDFFKNHVASHLMPLLHGVAMSHKDDASRKYALEVIVCFMEAKPKAMVKVPSYVEQTLEVCIRFMMELNEDIAEWAEQDEEDEGEEDEEHYVFGKEAIDRVCRCAHRVDCFPAVLEVLKPAILRGLVRARSGSSAAQRPAGASERQQAGGDAAAAEGTWQAQEVESLKKQVGAIGTDMLLESQTNNYWRDCACDPEFDGELHRRKFLKQEQCIQSLKAAAVTHHFNPAIQQQRHMMGTQVAHWKGMAAQHMSIVGQTAETHAEDPSAPARPEVLEVSTQREEVMRARADPEEHQDEEKQEEAAAQKKKRHAHIADNAAKHQKDELAQVEKVCVDTLQYFECQKQLRDQDTPGNDSALGSEGALGHRSALGREEALSYQKTLRHLDTLGLIPVTKLFQTGEWKPVVAAITALSQIAEYVDDEAAVAQMVQGILMQLAASHPRVRHTAWTSIAQFAQDHSETICTEAWVAQLVPKFIAVFDDTCPKVILRSMEAFQHYGESIEREDMEPFVPMLMEKLGVKLQQPLFQKKAITFVAVVASQVGDTFAPYYPQLMPALQAVVQRTLDKVEERMLLGKCFECMSLLGKAVGKEGFKNDAQAFMEAMIRATQVPNLPPTDPVKEYMLAAAERICSTMKDDFLPFVPHVLPSIVEKLTLGPKEWADGLDNLGDLKEGEVDLTLTQENGKVKVLVMYASDKQDLQAALEAVHTFVQELRKGYAPFVAQTAHALLPVFDFSMDEGIRSLAYETWGQLCQCARDGGQVQVASELVMEFLKRILPKFEEAEIDVAALKSRADGVTCCLKKAGPDILSMEQVEHIGSTAMRYLGESLQRRDQAAKGPPPGVQLPEDEDGGRDEEDEAEETNLRVALAEIAGAIMEHHPAAFVQQCFQSYLSLVLRLFESADREDRKLSLFVTCDFLEHLGTRVTTHWPQFMPKLLQDVRHESAELRQPACYGISLAARDPAFSEIAAAAATELVEVITKARQKAKKKSERPAQAVADNALSALVAILLNHQPAVAATEAQLWAVWLGGLPCQVDDEEGERNHKTLLRLVEQEIMGVVRPGANMPRLLAILVDVYQTDMVDQATSEGIGRLALRVGEAGLEGLAAQFTEKQRKKLLRVVREARKAAGAS
ncbi:unnamed protein product [Prorocentrum cordatum]|uniref:Importin-5 n=1 Tax=Prorocentrum cordatum TaxID=2364126 RepID=A0ABN9T2G2_9DINO|nr:unnamed protein product [Polarella glacialis]